MDPERAALETLVRSAGGRATIEPVTILGLALLSPWAGDRRDFLDRPNRIAPAHDAGVLLDFLAEVRPHVSGRRMPTDRGFLAWLRYRKLAVPAAELTKVPRWLTDPALSDAWIALPPVAGYRQGPVDTDVIEADGRVAALHMLVAQAANGPDPTSVPRDAVTRILEWLVGAHAAQWSSAASDQCERMRFTWQQPAFRAWFSSVNALPVEPVRQVITRAVPIVPEGWRVPPPTAAELAAEQERQRILELGKIQDKAWRNRGRQPVS
jgi:hypothetical protein